MRNSRTTMLVVVILVVAFATIVISSTLGGQHAGAGHTMPDGSSMQGETMP